MLAVVVERLVILAALVDTALAAGSALLRSVTALLARRRVRSATALSGIGSGRPGGGTRSPATPMPAASVDAHSMRFRFITVNSNFVSCCANSAH